MADSTIRTDIAALRKEKIRLRSRMEAQDREQKSLEIATQLFQTPQWKQAQALLVYASYGAEVSTFGLIEQALLEEKQVFCPRVEGKEMEFYRIFSRDELRAGFKGIPEPEGNTQRYVPEYGKTPRYAAEDGKTPRHAPEHGKMPQHVPEYGKTLLIAPGTAFDLCGNRIGYGGGYYDRYLQRFDRISRPYCIGICFACQLADQILPQEHDIPMDRVIYA